MRRFPRPPRLLIPISPTSASSQLATAPEFLLLSYFYLNVSGNGVALSEYICPTPGNDEPGTRTSSEYKSSFLSKAVFFPGCAWKEPFKNSFPIALDLKGSPVIRGAPLLLFPHLDLGYSQSGRGTHAIAFHGPIKVRH